MCKERCGLYNLELVERKKMAMTTLRKYNVWHRILGYTLEGFIHKIQQLGDIYTYSQFWDSCIIENKVCFLFQFVFSKTADCFDLIHVYIWVDTNMLLLMVLTTYC